MRINPPQNPYEDGLIGRLDAGVRLCRDEDEMARIRLEMLFRQRCRLAEFKRLSKSAGHVAPQTIVTKTAAL